MHCDGLSPDASQIAEAADAKPPQLELLAMIRPRAGQFQVDSHLLKIMLEQIAIAKHHGADGVVFGALTSAGNVDLESSRKLLARSRRLRLSSTFHRAVDATPDRFNSLKHIISLGFDRVLTSGIKWGSSQTALQGIDNISKMIKASVSDIEIVVGGGINGNTRKAISEELGYAAGKVSWHAYSGAMVDGKVSLQAVKQLTGSHTETE